jgi:hypothetical protein
MQPLFATFLSGKRSQQSSRATPYASYPYRWEDIVKQGMKRNKENLSCDGKGSALFIRA